MTTARKGLYASVRDLVDAVFNDAPPSPVGGMAAKFNALIAYLGDGVLEAPGLQIGAVPEKYKLQASATMLNIRAGGVSFTLMTAEKTFAAAHVISANKYGIVLIQAGPPDYDNGGIESKVPAGTQAYNTAALALAAKPAPDANKVEVGYILIANNAGDWTANTDDLTNGSDVTTATFVSATPLTLPAAF